MGYSDKQIKYIIELRESGLEWSEVADAYNDVFPNDSKTPNAIRKIYSRHCEFDYDTDDVLTKNMLENLKKAKQLKRFRLEQKELLNSTLTYEEFLEELKNINKNIPVKSHKKIKHSKKKKANRTIVAHICDAHAGAIFTAQEMDNINEFNPTIFTRRLAKYFKDLINYKKHHRKETDLVIVLNGDNLHGVIHDIESTLSISFQYTILLRALIQGISYAAQSFDSIKVYVTSGNHSRMPYKSEKGRQMQAKYDSFETITYVGLKEFFKYYKNIEFYIPKTPYCLFKIQGHTFLATHGDTFLYIGSPSKKIDTANITKQLNNFSAGLKEHIDVLLTGHVHKATYQILDNGSHLVINGTLMGTDTYAMSLGIVTNQPVQQFFEVTNEYPIGDMRFINLENADNDKSLDKIIEPFNGDF